MGTPNENSSEQINSDSNERNTVSETPKRTPNESSGERSNLDSKHDSQLESPDISIGSFFRNLKLGKSIISKKVSFANDRKTDASKAQTGVASSINHGDEIIRDVDLDDMTDRKRKIRKLRAKGKPFLLQRISKMTRLRDFLAIEEYEELVNDFSNKLIWVKPPKSVHAEELDQNRSSDSDFGNPNMEDEGGGK